MSNKDFRKNKLKEEEKSIWEKTGRDSQEKKPTRFSDFIDRLMGNTPEEEKKKKQNGI